MDETIIKKQYVTPAFSITAITFTDVILASNVEEYSHVVIDDGDWGDSLEDEMG